LSVIANLSAVAPLTSTALIYITFFL